MHDELLQRLCLSALHSGVCADSSIEAAGGELVSYNPANEQPLATVRTARVDITPSGESTSESAEIVQLFVFDAAGALVAGETLNFYDDGCCKPLVARFWT